MFSDRFTPGWIVAMALVLTATTALAATSWKLGGQADDFWLTLTTDGSVPDVIRAWAGAGTAGLCLAAVRLLAPAPYRPAPVGGG